MALDELQKRLDFEIIEESDDGVAKKSNHYNGSSSCTLIDKHASALVSEMRQMKESISCMFLGQSDESLLVKPTLRLCGSLNKNNVSTVEVCNIPKLGHDNDIKKLALKSFPSTEEGELYTDYVDKNIYETR